MQLAQTAPTTVTTKFERPEINFRKEMRIMAERQKPPSQKPPSKIPPGNENNTFSKNISKKYFISEQK